MKKMKISVLVLSAAMLLSGCSMTNTAKGGMIGGASGGAVGALVGHLIGGGKGAAIGSAVGVAVGAGTGVLIGNKMDKAKKAAEAAKAEAELLTDKDGMQYVKATFASGLLFKTGSSALNATAQADINAFIQGLKAEGGDYDLAIVGYTDNQGWKNSTAEQSKAKNQQLSLQRAQSVQSQILAAGYSASFIREVQGQGENYPVASNETTTGQEQNRRVEVYILPSKAMIEAANAAAQ